MGYLTQVANFAVVFLFFLLKTEEVNGVCTLSLKDDFGSPSPIFIRNGDYLLPNAKGDITLRKAEKLLVACPGDNRFLILSNQTTGFSSLEIKCVSNSLFRTSTDSWVGELKDLKCNHQPWYAAEDTRQACGNGRQTIYRVGYRVNNEYYKAYEACFDKELLTTLYVRHTLSPTDKLQNARRPTFIEGSVFGKVKMNNVYRDQKSTLDDILGKGMAQEYIDKNQYLSRGHLAPRADFPLEGPQRASFHYINAAPQWSRGNAGDWAALEDGLRRRVMAYKRPLTVYTGTFGVTTLLDIRKVDREIYLHQDGNNNGLIPVPLYYYKVVHDPQNKTAAAFISINSLFYNQTMLNQLSFCSDICEGNPKFRWLTWRANDGTHSFCCEYEDFIDTVDHLPDLDVKELFY